MNQDAEARRAEVEISKEKIKLAKDISDSYKELELSSSKNQGRRDLYFFIAVLLVVIGVIALVFGLLFTGKDELLEKLIVFLFGGAAGSGGTAIYFNRTHN